MIRNAAAGHSLVKIARDPDPARMAQLFDALKTPLPAGTRLVIDAGYAWADSAAAVAEVALWDAPELAWLEDPLVPEDIEGYRALGEVCHSGSARATSLARYRCIATCCRHRRWTCCGSISCASGASPPLVRFCSSPEPRG